VGISAFGATIAFAIVSIGVIRLRWREPERDRPYKMPLNVRMGRGELPLPAIVAAALSLAALVALLTYHGDSRWMGIGWMGFGVGLYVVYRLAEDKPVFKRVTVPEKALTRPRQEAEYGSILVPIRGLPLDDDIIQTAGRLAAEENEDMGEGGAVIEALWIFEVPMVLPLDARIPEEELKKARRALARAKAVGEEYEGVEVATAVVRARRAGEAIVHEARRRGVEAIVLAAEEKAQIRGGTLLGGKAGLRDTFVGETTRHVVNKAPCRVILTAAPPEASAESPVQDLSAPPPGGDPARPEEDEPATAAPQPGR
jgi:APA family basic amino acid/polyamine antiporter